MIVLDAVRGFVSTQVLTFGGLALVGVAIAYIRVLRPRRQSSGLGRMVEAKRDKATGSLARTGQYDPPETDPSIW